MRGDSEEKIDIEVRPAVIVREDGNEFTAAYWHDSLKVWVTNAGEKMYGEGPEKDPEMLTFQEHPRPEGVLGGD